MAYFNANVLVYIGQVWKIVLNIILYRYALYNYNCCWLGYRVVRYCDRCLVIDRRAMNQCSFLRTPVLLVNAIQKFYNYRNYFLFTHLTFYGCPRLTTPRRRGQLKKFNIFTGDIGLRLQYVFMFKYAGVEPIYSRSIETNLF